MMQDDQFALNERPGCLDGASLHMPKGSGGDGNAEACGPSDANQNCIKRGYRLACGTSVHRLDMYELARCLSSPCDKHRIVVTSRGHQRAVWHGTREIAVGHLGRGHITVLPATISGRLEIKEDTGFWCVSLAQNRLEACAQAIGHPAAAEIGFRLGVNDRTIASVVELLGDVLAGGSIATAYACERALDLLCLQLLQRYATTESERDLRQRGLAAWHLRKVAEYVEPRLARPLSLEDLARQVGLSRFHFCTSFRLAMGVTPNEWLTLKRMDRAAYLLLDSNLSIADISQAVGFGSASAFSACFKRVMGVTPTAYRHQSTPAH